MLLDQLIEKPATDKAPSNLAIAGRYILTPEIYKSLEKTPKGKGNEIQLTDAMLLLLKTKAFMHTPLKESVTTSVINWIS